jgi:hypothetical protein
VGRRESALVPARCFLAEPATRSVTDTHHEGAAMSQMRRRAWTVVQHSDYGYGGDPQFERGLGVRELGVHGEPFARELGRVNAAGGLVFDSTAEAVEFEQGARPMAPGRSLSVVLPVKLRGFVPIAGPCPARNVESRSTQPGACLMSVVHPRSAVRHRQSPYFGMRALVARERTPLPVPRSPRVLGPGVVALVLLVPPVGLFVLWRRLSRWGRSASADSDR